jgi:putative ABC transport system permease protein
MRPAWRLAISSLSIRRSRTALLVASVALSAGLIAAVACAMASLHAGIRTKVEQTVGAADLRVQRVGKDVFDLAVLEQIEKWPETALAVGRMQGALSLVNARNSLETTAIGNGVMPDREYTIRPQEMISGRAVAADGEIVLDASAAEELEAVVGDVLNVQRFGDPISFTVVGIAKRPPLGMLSRPEAFVTLSAMGLAADRPGKLREIDVVIRDTTQSEAIALARAAEFDKGIVLRAASKVTSGLDKNLQSSQIGMTIASMLSFLSAAFIIMTGLSTNVNERQRELAVLRCIGGTKPQLAESQLAVGLIVGSLGALCGIPLGVLGAWVMVKLFPDQLPGGLAINWFGLFLAFIGSVGAGLLGALWPALRASRTSPLEAMAVRSRPPTRRGLILCAIVGLALAATHICILTIPSDTQVVFWLDMAFGLPALFTGYFLLAVPITVLTTILVGPLVSALFRLPGRGWDGILVRNVLAAPYRFGFTAGAMMVGLAIMVAIWTNGRAIMRDWLGSLTFPDAFASGLAMTPRTQERIDNLPFVIETCAVTIQNFRTDAFGVRALSNPTTSFVAFEPDPFFRMTKLTWVEGDPVTALAKLNAGGSVLIAKEFQVARGLGVGDTLTLTYNDKPYDFEIAGVVASPGLDIASKFFDIGDEYLDQAVNAVFGSREDLKTRFGNTGIQLIQISLDPAISDEQAMKDLRRAGGFEVIAAGSGRQIKAEISKFLTGSLVVSSVVAICAMLVACFGVANLIVAGIQARQFEFGVLRAIGAQRGLLARLVLAEATLIALSACVVGTVMGIHASWGGQHMYEILLGIELTMQIPFGPTSAGWATVLLITLAAAAPAVLALARKQPRELLGAVRG